MKPSQPGACSCMRHGCCGAGMRRNILITAGMLCRSSPFNPMTTDMITRFSPISMSQLWRELCPAPLRGCRLACVEALCGLWRLRSVRAGSGMLPADAADTPDAAVAWAILANAFSRLRAWRARRKSAMFAIMDLLKQPDNPGADFLSKFGRSIWTGQAQVIGPAHCMPYQQMDPAQLHELWIHRNSFPRIAGRHARMMSCRVPCANWTLIMTGCW